MRQFAMPDLDFPSIETTHAIHTGGTEEQEADCIRAPGQLGPPDIEPAFLNARDYPKGWLVFHPSLGVVPKSEADAHESKNRQARSQKDATENGQQDQPSK